MNATKAKITQSLISIGKLHDRHYVFVFHVVDKVSVEALNVINIRKKKTGIAVLCLYGEVAVKKTKTRGSTTDNVRKLFRVARLQKIVESLAFISMERKLRVAREEYYNYIVFKAADLLPGFDTVKTGHIHVKENCIK